VSTHDRRGPPRMAPNLAPSQGAASDVAAETTGFRSDPYMVRNVWLGAQNARSVRVLPDGVDPRLHRSVPIWCLRFAAPFASAPLG